MSEKSVCKKINFPKALWREIEEFADQNFIEVSQEALRILISRGLRSGIIPDVHTTYREDLVIKNCFLYKHQWEMINDYRFKNRMASVSETIRSLVIDGLTHEKSYGMYVPVTKKERKAS